MTPSAHQGHGQASLCMNYSRNITFGPLCQYNIHYIIESNYFIKKIVSISCSFGGTANFGIILPLSFRLELRTLFIKPDNPWENRYIESFNGKLRDVLLDRYILTRLTEVKVLIADWRKEYKQFRPYISIDYEPPVP